MAKLIHPDDPLWAHRAKRVEAAGFKLGEEVHSPPTGIWWIADVDQGFALLQREEGFRLAEQRVPIGDVTRAVRVAVIMFQIDTDCELLAVMSSRQEAVSKARTMAETFIENSDSDGVVTVRGDTALSDEIRVDINNPDGSSRYPAIYTVRFFTVDADDW